MIKIMGGGPMPSPIRIFDVDGERLVIVRQFMASVETLRDLSAPRALVVCDGETLRIPGREVVNGDILVLEAGDRIAADAVVVEAQEFEADESLLTGEALPVSKRPRRSGDAERAEPGVMKPPISFRERS